MGLFEFMWDLGVSPMNAIMCITGLVLLFVLRATAKSEMAAYKSAKSLHDFNWAVVHTDLGNGKYCHGVYEYNKWSGMSNNAAYENMQSVVGKCNIGDIYKPYGEKPTLMTRILMLRVGDKH